VCYVYALVPETVINDWNVIQNNMGEHLHGLHGSGNGVQEMCIVEMMGREEERKKSGRERQMEVKEREMKEGSRGGQKKRK
jgi:hypothetical protein